jgi:PAS domain-containing protein
MAEALPTKLMTNDQPYRGLESFVLSRILSNAKGRINPDPSEDVIAQFKDLTGQLSQLTLSKDDYEDLGAKLVWFGPPSADGYVKNATSSSGEFLFQPGFSFQAADEPTQTTALLRSNPDIAMEIDAAYKSQPLLATLLGHKIDGAPIVQAYFMGQSGTLMIMGRSAESKRMTRYDSQFSSYRYFPSRPYFWKAVNNEDSKGDFNHVTVPYVDYGGKGPVITYCWRLRLPRGRWAMLGMDCGIPDGSARLANQLQRIDKNQRRLAFELRETDRGLRLGRLSNDFTQQEKAWLDSVVTVANALHEASSVTGQIVSKISTNDDILFAVPTGWSDLALLVTAVLSFGLFAGSVGLLISQYAHTRNEQEHLLQSFATIMSDSVIPFAWVNEKNEFESVNPAFCRLLGFSSADELKYKASATRRTFIEMLKDAAAYREMLLRSGRGEPTGPRWWTIETQGGQWLDIKVHGEGVLIRRAKTRDRLHRFGVVVDQRGQLADPVRA